MTVMHGAQHWIAKLQDRGDAPNSPLREYLAMKSARAAGIHAAEVELHRDGPHQVVAVKRFDSLVRDDFQVQRHGFASAHTMLRLDSATMRGDPLRSYPTSPPSYSAGAGLTSRRSDAPVCGALEVRRVWSRGALDGPRSPKTKRRFRLDCGSRP